MKYSEMKEFLDEMKPHRDYWRNKNHYYYSYLNSFVDFLVPKGKKVFDVPFGTLAIRDNGQKFDYVIISDRLGYIYDVQTFMEEVSRIMEPGGKVVITQYNALWEPVLRLASWIGFRMPSVEQNWLSMGDLKNLASLAGFEVVKSGTKMLLPKYIPLISAFFNKIVANIFPFSRLGLFHYIVAAKRAETEKINGFKSNTEPSISIVVPARNESGTIERIVRELPEIGSFTEIIFVEGNSTDDTWEEINRVAKKYATTRKIKITRQGGKGKGDAVRKGFDMAEGDILAIYDADMTVPPEEMDKFYQAIVSGKGEFVNGSRLVYPMQKESMRVLNFFGNKFFSFAFSAILGQVLKDTLCGTKVLWRQDYEDIKENRGFFGDFDPFGDFDLLFGAAKLNLKIIDLPVHYKERVYGSTNISRWKHGWLLLRMTIFAARKIRFI